MKQALALVLFAIFLISSGYAVAQGNVDQRMIDMEKRRLQQNIDDYSSNPRLSAQTKENLIGPLKAKMDELDRDPEYYFYKKQQRSPSSSPRVVIGLDPTTGKVGPVLVK